MNLPTTKCSGLWNQFPLQQKTTFHTKCSSTWRCPGPDLGLRGCNLATHHKCRSPRLPGRDDSVVIGSPPLKQAMNGHEWKGNKPILYLGKLQLSTRLLTTYKWLGRSSEYSQTFFLNPFPGKNSCWTGPDRVCHIAVSTWNPPVTLANMQETHIARWMILAQML